jgi:starch synthase
MTARKKAATPRKAAAKKKAAAKSDAVALSEAKGPHVAVASNEPAVALSEAKGLHHAGRRVTIVHVTAEVSPWLRVGELGDSVGDLARAQAAGGRDVIVIAPCTLGVRAAHPALVPVGLALPVPMGASTELVQLWGEADPAPGAPWLLFVAHVGAFDREGLYGDAVAPYADNAWRFALLAHAAVAAVRRLVAGPAVVHAHDWHGALASVVEALQPEAERHATVLTVHDAAFQGHVRPEALPYLGMPNALYRPDALEWYGLVNMLKGGMAFAQQVVATSPSHAAELCTAPGGFGLDGLFRWRGDAFTGIADGLDAAAWDPATDPALSARFGPTQLAERAKNKAALQRSARLPVRARTPLVVLPAPLARRSGAALALESAFLRETTAQLVIAGAGDRDLVAAAHALADAHPGRVAVLPPPDARMERRLLAGADLVLLPALHEPSAHLARRAIRYGAQLVVRNTGAHHDLPDLPGIVRFQPFEAEALDRALDAALVAFEYKKDWDARTKALLALPAGWDDAVAAYDARYLAALAAHDAGASA